MPAARLRPAMTVCIPGDATTVGVVGVIVIELIERTIHRVRQRRRRQQQREEVDEERAHADENQFGHRNHCGLWLLRHHRRRRRRRRRSHRHIVCTDCTVSVCARMSGDRRAYVIIIAIIVAARCVREHPFGACGREADRKARIDMCDIDNCTRVYSGWLTEQ